MKDTDGDGKADVDETWFEGFAEQNSQLRANHPRLALDNWIYVANGLRGGKVVNKQARRDEADQHQRDGFSLSTRSPASAEAVSGNGQFGLCFDDWGNRFTCSNRNPVRHVVIEDRYLKANPAVTVPATVNDVAAFGEQSRIFPDQPGLDDIEPARRPVHRGLRRLYLSRRPAAGGVQRQRLHLRPTGNLIHREIMQPAGPTFTSASPPTTAKNSSPRPTNGSAPSTWNSAPTARSTSSICTAASSSTPTLSPTN